MEFKLSTGSIFFMNRGLWKAVDILWKAVESWIYPQEGKICLGGLVEKWISPWIRRGFRASAFKRLPLLQGAPNTFSQGGHQDDK